MLLIKALGIPLAEAREINAFLKTIKTREVVKIIEIITKKYTGNKQHLAMIMVGYKIREQEAYDLRPLTGG